MAKILQFDLKKRKKKKVSLKKADAVKKDNNSTQIRYYKVMNYLTWVNSQYKHKFSYPTLAFRYPKDTHSFDVLYGHCFTESKEIQKDSDEYPGIAHAKRWAVERQDEIDSFINWRRRKYQEAKTLYGADLIVIDIYIDVIEEVRTLFQELFKSHGRT